MLKTVLGALALVFVMTAAQASAQDVRGSRDHPAVTRYPGSVIAWYETQNHLAYRIGAGPVTGYRAIDRWQDFEGRSTRVYYELRGQRTHAEVYANYKRALTEAGFELIADGIVPTSRPGTQIGSRAWLGVQYGANAFPSSAGVDLLAGTATAGGSAFLAGRKRDAGLVVAIGIVQQRSDRVVYLVDVIETGQAQTGLVAVTAKAIGEGLDARGKAVLDGLYFDTDKATLRPESKPAIEQIAQLLAGRPQLRAFVVGHTDTTGQFAYNMQLSAARARTVVETLVRDYRIAPSRLEAQGVGPLSPVAANRTEAGRAQNRRVELVER